MSNYTQSTFFGPKDALTPGDPLKKIKGTEVDSELAAITTAISSKADNTGPTSSLTALTAPGADRLVFWDHSATAYDWLNAIGSNSGLTIAGTAISVDITGLTLEASLLSSHYFMIWNGTALRKVQLNQITHDGLTGYVANRHIDHSAVTLTAGLGISGGGTIEASRTFALDPSELAGKSVPTLSDYVVIADAAASSGPKVVQLSILAEFVRDYITLPVAKGGTGATTAANARTNLGLAIGTDVQAYDADLAALAGFSFTDGNFVVTNGTTFVAESGSTARASLGLGSIATRNVTVSTSAPSGGSDTDLWFVRAA